MKENVKIRYAYMLTKHIVLEDDSRDVNFDSFKGQLTVGKRNCIVTQ